MTLTEKRELEHPWGFAITQMSKGQGPGFTSLYLNLCPPATAKVIQKTLSDL